MEKVFVAKDSDGKKEVFAEVSLFGKPETGSSENGDCGCFDCDGNPCIKFSS